MSITDHYGYTTRPLVEYNLDLYTDRASFLGWLGHMSERRRLAITLDPAASDPARTKNKRVQVTSDLERGESEPEIIPAEPPTSAEPTSIPQKVSKKGQSTRKNKRKKESESEEGYKPPKGLKTSKSKRGSLRSSPRSRASSVKSYTSAYGRITDEGGKCTKYLYGRKQDDSESDISLRGKEDDNESHSDSFTDS